jgi:hypothetical protein
MSLSRDDFSLPPAWRPNPGDIVEGTVDRIESILGGAYEPYWALVLKLDGERALRPSPARSRTATSRRSPCTPSTSC